MKIIKKLYEMMSSDEAKLFTNGLAYSLLVGIAPLIIILVAFFGVYVVQVDQMIEFLSRYIPFDLVMPFVNYLKGSNTSNPTVLVSLLSISLWVGSKSVHSFLIMNRSYTDTREMNGILLRLLSVGYFIVLLVALLGIVVCMVWLKIDTSFILVPISVFFLTIFYKVVGTPKRKFFTYLPGACFASLSLLIVGQLFFVYVNDFSNYNTIYGPLASIVVMLISSWIIALILFFGYSLNHVVYNRENITKTL